jgi:hypothetical protein
MSADTRATTLPPSSLFVALASFAGMIVPGQISHAPSGAWTS